MISSQSAPLQTVQDVGVAVARGQVTGSKPVGSFGEMTTGAGVTSNKIVWPNGAFKIPDSVGVTIDLVSSSADDTFGGSGVNSVEIHYLDIDLAEQSLVVNMAGLTPVVAVLTGVRFINCMHLEVPGTYGQGAVGEIKAYAGAQTYSVIAPGDTRCASSARMVPAGKRIMVAGLAASSISASGSGAQALIQVVATELDTHQYPDQGLFFPFGSLGAQDGSEAFNLPVPIPFREGTVIAMYLKTVDKPATITADWFGWQEDAP